MALVSYGSRMERQGYFCRKGMCEGWVQRLLRPEETQPLVPSLISHFLHSMYCTTNSGRGLRHLLIQSNALVRFGV